MSERPKWAIDDEVTGG